MFRTHKWNVPAHLVSLESSYAPLTFHVTRHHWVSMDEDILFQLISFFFPSRHQSALISDRLTNWLCWISSRAFREGKSLTSGSAPESDCLIAYTCNSYQKSCDTTWHWSVRICRHQLMSIWSENSPLIDHLKEEQSNQNKSSTTERPNQSAYVNALLVETLERIMKSIRHKTE